jgi:hypothetical protein
VVRIGTNRHDPASEFRELASETGLRGRELASVLSSGVPYRLIGGLN